MALNAGPENATSKQRAVPVEEIPPLNPEFPYVRIPFVASLFGADKPAPAPPRLTGGTEGDASRS